MKEGKSIKGQCRELTETKTRRMMFLCEHFFLLEQFLDRKQHACVEGGTGVVRAGGGADCTAADPKLFRRILALRLADA